MKQQEDYIFFIKLPNFYNTYKNSIVIPTHLLFKFAAKPFLRFLIFFISFTVKIIKIILIKKHF